jgi:hypothetical protein
MRYFLCFYKPPYSNKILITSLKLYQANKRKFTDYLPLQMLMETCPLYQTQAYRATRLIPPWIYTYTACF